MFPLHGRCNAAKPNPTRSYARTISGITQNLLKAEPPRRMRNILTRLEEFLFSPASDQWLAVLRLGLGLQVMLYCLSLRNDWHQMLSGAGSGFINREFTESLLTNDGPVIPRLGWVVALGSQLGLAEKTILSITWILLFCAGCGLLLGLFCRTSAITAWFIHLCAAKSGDFLTYGMDN